MGAYFADYIEDLQKRIVGSNTDLRKTYRVDDRPRTEPFRALRRGKTQRPRPLANSRRRTVGYALGRRIDARLTLAALTAAIEGRNPPPGCIHHSDRGSQYAAQAYRALLDEHGLVGSMARRGNLYDNAMMERFMKTLKVEGVYPMAFESTDDVAEHLPRFIDSYYERPRHSALGYLSPNRYEEEQSRTPVKSAA